MNSYPFISILTNVGWPSHSSVDPIEMVGFTCCGVGHGVSTVAANVAAAVAGSGKQTLLVDCDFLRPSLHRAFQRTQAPGLTDLIGNFPESGQPIQVTSVPNLRLLSAGNCETQPTWNEESVSVIFRSILSEYDLVICDIPALGTQKHTSSVLALMDRVFVVVDSKITSSNQLADYRRLMVRQGIAISGIVLNRQSSTFGNNRQ